MTGSEVFPWHPGRIDGMASAISATSDAEAVALWIKTKGSRSPHTFEAYRKEGERLLLWLDQERLTLATMVVEDVHRYFQMLGDPPPYWIRPKKLKKGQALLATQVLHGPLSVRSIAYTRTVLGQMFTYLQDAGYLQRNVFRLSANPPLVHDTAPSRLLDLETWRWLWGWLKNHSMRTTQETAKARRLRWTFALFYHTGLRLSEVARARMGDFVRRDGYWSLQVLGKGNKRKLVTINTALLRELVAYREFLGLPSFPTPGDSTPLIVSMSGTRRAQLMSARAIRQFISSAAQEAAQSCEDDHIKAALHGLSPHWLRHTSATHRLYAGASLETIQEELGHEDPKTTRLYAKVSNQKRMDDAEKLAKLSETTENSMSDPSPKALPGLWREEGGLSGLLRLDVPAIMPGMVVVAKADEPWQSRPELRWQTWPELLHPDS